MEMVVSVKTKRGQDILVWTYGHWKFPPNDSSMQHQTLLVNKFHLWGGVQWDIIYYPPLRVRCAFPICAVVQPGGAHPAEDLLCPVVVERSCSAPAHGIGSSSGDPNHQQDTFSQAKWGSCRKVIPASMLGNWSQILKHQMRVKWIHVGSCLSLPRSLWASRITLEMLSIF